MEESTAQGEELSERAKQLLERLRQGDRKSIAIPSVYAGAEAFSSHAKAYLSNAALLCKKPEAHDFCIFGALYGIRHGLELWLKYLAINSMIDTALERIALGAGGVEAVAQALDLKKDQKRHFCRSLCIVRNYCEDGLVYPACVQQNINSTWADKAILFIQRNGHLDRYLLADIWTVPVHGHALLSLWQKVERRVRELNRAVSAHVRVVGGGAPMPPDDLAAVCELMHGWDPGGDAFRYPLSLDGRWNTEFPWLSLKSLGDLATDLQKTVLGYGSLLDESYRLSRLRSPRPNTGHY